MNQSLNIRPLIEEVDPFERFPVEDLANWGLFKALGMTTKEVRQLIRMGKIGGFIDSRNEVSISLHEFRNYQFVLELSAELRRAAFASAENIDQEYDRAVIIIEYLLHKILKKPIRIQQLRKAFE